VNHAACFTLVNSLPPPLATTLCNIQGDAPTIQLEDSANGYGLRDEFSNDRNTFTES
jgi:hypothetical protein